MVVLLRTLRMSYAIRTIFLRRKRHLFLLNDSIFNIFVLYARKVCHMWKKGKCNAGIHCRHAHGAEELKRFRQVARTTSTEELKTLLATPPPPPPAGMVPPPPIVINEMVSGIPPRAGIFDAGHMVNEFGPFLFDGEVVNGTPLNGDGLQQGDLATFLLSSLSGNNEETKLRGMDARGLDMKRTELCELSKRMTSECTSVTKTPTSASHMSSDCSLRSPEAIQLPAPQLPSPALHLPRLKERDSSNQRKRGQLAKLRSRIDHILRCIESVELSLLLDDVLLNNQQIKQFDDSSNVEENFRPDGLGDVLKSLVEFGGCETQQPPVVASTNDGSLINDDTLGELNRMVASVEASVLARRPTRGQRLSVCDLSKPFDVPASITSRRATLTGSETVHRSQSWALLSSNHRSGMMEYQDSIQTLQCNGVSPTYSTNNFSDTDLSSERFNNLVSDCCFKDSLTLPGLDSFDSNFLWKENILGVTENNAAFDDTAEFNTSYPLTRSRRTTTCYIGEVCDGAFSPDISDGSPVMAGLGPDHLQEEYDRQLSEELIDVVPTGGILQHRIPDMNFASPELMSVSPLMFSFRVL